MQVPPGVAPGQMMTVQTAQGQMQVAVPAGVGPGQTFSFQVPAAQPAVAVAAPVQMATEVKPQQMVVGIPGANAPPGAPEGGTWSTQQYTGNVSLIIVVVILLLFWPAFAAPFCCPCDSRESAVVRPRASSRCLFIF